MLTLTPLLCAHVRASGWEWESGISRQLASNDEESVFEQNIPMMTFSIKKRINTKVFIDRKQGLYIQKVDKETDQENI